MWQCPLCNLPLKTLEQDEANSPLKTWICENNHSFDKAKQGYVNLLPVQNKRSKMPGDDKQMVTARARFFSTEPYHPLAIRLSTLIADLVFTDTESGACKSSAKPVDISPKPINIYDSGCGEGYYLQSISDLLPAGLLYSGHDISKAAVIAAAKRNKNKQLVVASTINIPVVEQSQDVILQIFAPSCASEYYRILKSEAYVIAVDPAPQHLFELKALVYDTPQQHNDSDSFLQGFCLVEEQNLCFKLNLESEQMRLALLMMTPFYWTSDEKKRTRIKMELQQVTADFKIRVWQKSSKP